MDEHFFSDQLDSEILMHRDAHFGGLFRLMLPVYEKQGRGVQDFPLHRIAYLARIEEQTGKNLAPALLSPHQIEKVVQAKKAYAALSQAYERKDVSKEMRLVLDLLLQEEDPSDVVDAIVSMGSAMTPLLVQVLKNHDLYDPLFPGFGEAPAYAAQCLGRIGDADAVRPLFECLGKGDFDVEEQILQALSAMQKVSQPFLLRILQSRPITEDNLHASMALSTFNEDEEIATCAFAVLQKLDLKRYMRLSSYLILASAGLKSAEGRKSFYSFTERPDIPPSLQDELHLVIKSWK